MKLFPFKEDGSNKVIGLLTKSISVLFTEIRSINPRIVGGFVNKRTPVNDSKDLVVLVYLNFIN